MFPVLVSWRIGFTIPGVWGDYVPEFGFCNARGLMNVHCREGSACSSAPVRGANNLSSLQSSVLERVILGGVLAV